MTAARVRVPRPVPWHPVLLSLAIVVNFWLETAVSPYAAFRSAALAVGAAVILTAVAGAVARSWPLGAFAASLILFLAWSKQLVAVPLRLAERGQVAVAVIVTIALLGIAVLVLRVILRRKRSLTVAGASRFLNLGALLLLVATLLSGTFNGRLFVAANDLRQGVELGSWQSATDRSSSPDIYVLLLDGYPRADVLEYAFGIDNSEFVGALEDRGFAVAAESHSDYLWTHVSVPSALNMAYVEQIPAMLDVIEGRLPRQPTLRRTISDNAVFEEARERGYATIAVGAGFEEVAPRQADVYLDGGQLNEFEINLLMSTWVGDVVGIVAPDFASAQQRSRIRYNLDAPGRIAGRESAGPVLVFDHVPAPHQPVVFGRDGAAVEVPISDAYFADSPQERGQDPGEFAERYRAQLPYLNDLVLDAVDGILERSEEPPIIVLFADHGSASAVDWNVTDPEDADPARVLERTGILFAALTPGHDGLYPDDISPVDIFRLLFDAYFGTNYGRAQPPPGGGQVDPPPPTVLDGSAP